MLKKSAYYNLKFDTSSRSTRVLSAAAPAQVDAVFQADCELIAVRDRHTRSEDRLREGSQLES